MTGDSASPRIDHIAYVQLPGAVLRGAPTDPIVTVPSGERFGLSSEVAVMIFQLCRSPTTPRELARRVVELYEVSQERAEQDVAAFLEALADVGALGRVPTGDQAPEAES